MDAYFCVEKSFTLLDWLIIDKAIQKTNFDMFEVYKQRRLQLAMNILPNGKGILHLLSDGRYADKPHINQMAMALF